MADYAEIVEALRAKREGLDEPNALRHRLRRCISWIERAAAANDQDAKCIFLWIAFNAVYAIERKAAKAQWGGEEPKEWQLQRRFFEKLIGVEFVRIHRTLRNELRGAVDRIMSNEYVFYGFWDCLTDEPFDWGNWRQRRRFEDDHAEIKELLRKGHPENTLWVLDRIFERLSTLRNQLMHGCATQAGGLNRRQVDDGAEILEKLVPLFVDVMADHPEEDWGKISFPVRDDIREDRR